MVASPGTQAAGDPAGPPADTIETAAQATTTAERVAPTACVGRPDARAGDRELSLASGGRERTAVVHLPPDYDPARPSAVVLDFHGHGGNARSAQHRHGFDALSDADGVLIVYPQGLPQLDGLNGWSTGARGRDGGDIDDVAFTDDLLALIDAEFCVDADRVFVTGHSNGGGMTGLLACRRAGVFAAFAPVSGAFYAVTGGCSPDRSAPMFEIHGVKDPVVPYLGSDRFPAIADWLADWAVRNGCSGSTTTGELTTWQGCAAPLEHLAIADGTHEYPSVAAERIWEFFGRQGLLG